MSGGENNSMQFSLQIPLIPLKHVEKLKTTSKENDGFERFKGKET